MAKCRLQWELDVSYSFLAKHYKSSWNRYKRIVFVAITRKGYSFYQMMRKRREELGGENILEHFNVISDRYLSKLTDRSEFQKYIQREEGGKDVLVILFDDFLNRGNSIFQYYTLLKGWGANVVPVVYTCTLSSEGKLEIGSRENNTKWEEFQEIFQHAEADQGERVGEDSQWTKYDQYITEFNDKLVFAKYSTLEDKSRFNQELLKCLEKESYPMVIDLPMIGIKAGEHHRLLEFSKEAWCDFLSYLREKEWNFVKNVVQEPDQLNVTASFLETPSYIAESLPSETIFNSIVKCKYHVEEEKVRAIFIPFVIMRSLGYEILADYFIELYHDTDYGNSIRELFKENGDTADFKQKLLCGLESNVNLYVALYRAVVWYFSSYIGIEFIHCANSVLANGSLDYDWKFMEDHMPPELINTIHDQWNHIGEMRDRIKILAQKGDGSAIQNEMGAEAADWDKILYFGKAQMAECKYKRDSRTVSIEELEKKIKNKFYFTDEKKEKNLITRMITALLEESFWGNSLYNDRKNGRVFRGLAPGECSALLYGEPLEFVYPYVYAFYIKEGQQSYEKKYSHFMEILRAFLEKEGILGNDVPECAFDFYTKFFGSEGQILREKITNCKYILHDFLRGQNNRYKREFNWVQNLEL